MANNSYHTLLTHFKQIKIQKYAREMHTRLENASNAADNNLPGNLPVKDPICTCTLAENTKVVAKFLLLP